MIYHMFLVIHTLNFELSSHISDYAVQCSS